VSYFRTARTELAVRSQRTWRPSRAGDVDVAMQTDGQKTGHLRWLLSEDGRTAIPPQDAAEIVRAWRESRVSIAVTDGGRFGSASIFDLSGRNGPRQIGGSLPLASIANRGTRLLTKGNPADGTYKDEIGFTLRPFVCCRFLGPLTDRRSVRMGL
jgi:hypothetical protein